MSSSAAHNVAFASNGANVGGRGAQYARSSAPRNSELDALDKQYDEYKASYDEWKEKNKSLSHTKAYEDYVNQFKQWEADVNTRRRGILGTTAAPSRSNERPAVGQARQPVNGATRGNGTPPVDISESSDESDSPIEPRRRRRSRSRDSTPPLVRKEIRNGQAISFNISGATNQPADRRAVLPIGVSNYDLPRARTPERPQQQLVEDYNESMQQQQHRQRQAQRQQQAAQQIKHKVGQQLAAAQSLAEQYRQHEQTQQSEQQLETQPQQYAPTPSITDTITANDGTSIRMTAMDPFTFISSMMTLMAADAQSAMTLMMQMNGGQLPANVADVANLPTLTDARRSTKKKAVVMGPSNNPDAANAQSGYTHPTSALPAMPHFPIPPPDLLMRKRMKLQAPTNYMAPAASFVAPSSSNTYAVHAPFDGDDNMYTKWGERAAPPSGVKLAQQTQAGMPAAVNAAMWSMPPSSTPVVNAPSAQPDATTVQQAVQQILSASTVNVSMPPPGMIGDGPPRTNRDFKTVT